MSCAVDEKHNVTLVSNEVLKKLNRIDVPEGYSITMDGEDEMIKESVTTVRELAFITGSSFPIVQKDSRPLILSKKISGCAGRF